MLRCFKKGPTPPKRPRAIDHSNTRLISDLLCDSKKAYAPRRSLTEKMSTLFFLSLNLMGRLFILINIMIFMPWRELIVFLPTVFILILVVSLILTLCALNSASKVNTTGLSLIENSGTIMPKLYILGSVTSVLQPCVNLNTFCHVFVANWYWHIFIAASWLLVIFVGSCMAILE